MKTAKVMFFEEICQPLEDQYNLVPLCSPLPYTCCHKIPYSLVAEQACAPTLSVAPGQPEVLNNENPVLKRSPHFEKKKTKHQTLAI